MTKRFPLFVAVWALLALSCSRTRSPHSDVPVTHEIDWWVYQDGLTVSSLAPTVIESNLNLMNHTALLALQLGGTISSASGWRPSVRAVHLTQQFTPGSTDTKRTALLTYTPVVSVTEDSSYRGAPVGFAVRIEHRVSTWWWGPNELILRSGPIETHLTLHQRK